jgi:hypothetical protein
MFAGDGPAMPVWLLLLFIGFMVWGIILNWRERHRR